MRSDSEQGIDSGFPQTQRLPVNPRRHKVAPEHRKRVVRACNACNIRRVKCSGDQPCHRCRKGSRECEYAVPESSRTALLNENERLRRRCAQLETAHQMGVQDETATPIHYLEKEKLPQSNKPTFWPMSTWDSTEAASGRHLRDLDGTTRFLGETSGATFLDHLKEFMLKLVPLTFRPDSGDGSAFVASIGQYQTFDSRPLPNPNVDPLWLPDTSAMLSMLAELRHLIQDGDDDFLSGGNMWWGDMSKPPVPTANSVSLSALTTEDTHRPLAFYHVCFALASSINHVSFRLSEQHTGEAYFKRARLLLGNPLDTVRFTLSDVPVLTLMAFYLIELNRRDAAYMYVSLAIHIAVIHGAFRTIHDEASKRTFWTLYILDRWLSVLMGRPPTLADEAIRLPLPCDVISMPPSAGIRANIELARISGYIVCETFKIAPRNHRSGSSTRTIDKALDMLENWQRKLAPELDFNSTEPSCNILHMAHNQLIVLTTRPIFLAAVKQAVAARFHGSDWSVEQHAQATHIIACSKAALRNLTLAQRLQRKRKFLQCGLHFLFNASVVLLLDRIASSAWSPILDDHNTTPPDEQLHASEILFATNVFEQESKTGTHYPKDCCQVLQDLKALVDRYLSQNWDWIHNEPNLRSAHSLSTKADNMDDTLSIGHVHMPWTGNDGIHEDLFAWIQSDGLHVRDSMLI